MLNEYFNEIILSDTKKCFEGIKKLGKSGYSNIVLFYASLYFVLRKKKEPYLLIDISKISGIPKKKITRCFNFIISKSNQKISPHDPFLLIKSHAEKLGLSKEIAIESVNFLTKMRESSNFIGKSPATIAATSIFLICNRNEIAITKKKISDSFGISTITIKSLFEKWERASH